MKINTDREETKNSTLLKVFNACFCLYDIEMDTNKNTEEIEIINDNPLKGIRSGAMHVY